MLRNAWRCAAGRGFGSQDPRVLLPTGFAAGAAGWHPEPTRHCSACTCWYVWQVLSPPCKASFADECRTTTTLIEEVNDSFASPLAVHCKHFVSVTCHVAVHICYLPPRADQLMLSLCQWTSETHACFIEETTVASSTGRLAADVDRGQKCVR
mmetsp:Transcript_69836/g.175948  ORF Transcript_69836/g.175948 Transcript_69836/m.175948 type:complete len:153 (+) Transcript_69836:1089-1547(+)